jgi:F-type H+-transporting ATPase subunit epsilon
MAYQKLKLEIVTPEGVTTSEEVEYVALPGLEGELGVYPGHVPLMTQILAGQLQVRNEDKEYNLAVGDGFVEITADRVSVLTDMAIKADSIDEAAAEEARRRAEARLKEKLTDEEQAAVQASLLRATTQLKVKRQYRGGGPG